MLKNSKKNRIEKSVQYKGKQEFENPTVLSWQELKMQIDIIMITLPGK